MVIVGLALIVGVAGFAGGIFIDIARNGAVAALLAHAVIELWSGQKRFMTSPLFLLSCIGVFIFSAFQSIWGPESPWPSQSKDFTVFIGSTAEAVILAFCMVSLIIYLAAWRRFTVSKSPGDELLPRYSNKLIVLLFAITVVVSFIDIMTYSLNPLQVAILAGFAKLHFIVPPLITISLCLLIRGAPTRGPGYKIAVFLLAMAVLGGLVYVHEGKLVMFMLVAITLYAFRQLSFSPSQLFVAALAGLLIILAFVQVVQHTRWKVSAGPNQTNNNYSRILLSKGVWRQTETGYCFANVIKGHTGDSFEISKQAFWIKGLVPRILWPNKPSLSLGQEYAVKYCSKLPKHLGDHSASITLLGQPVIHGGIIGLVVHGGILLLILAGVEKFNVRRSALSTAMVAAMLPWLMDFDQDFAMYIANAVKFALVMGVLFVPIAIISSRNSIALTESA